MSPRAKGTGTSEDPWVLTTPPGTSEYQLHRDDSNEHDPKNNRVRARP